MNTKVIGVIAALILLLGAGGAYFLSQNKTATNTNQTQTPTTAENKTSSLLDLLNLGKNQSCTFKTTASSGVATEGTIYIADGKMRGDFKTTSNGKEEEISMIRDGDMNYIWGSSLETGIKMKVSIDELSKNQQASQFVNPDAKLAYNCMPWNTDSSLFTPPSNIKFTDMSSFVMPKTTGTTTQTQSDSSPCAQITNEVAKAACENAMQQSGQ